MTDAAAALIEPLSQAAINLPPNGEDDGWARPLAARQLEVLGELAELGLKMARAVERQASGEAPAPEPVFQGDLAMAFARVSRAVRMTVLLQARLIQDLEDGPRAAARARAEAEFNRVEGRKAQVERIVEREAEALHPEDEEAVDRLVFEAAERLDDETLYGDLLERPIGEVVERIRRDLGLASPVRGSETAGGGPSAEEPMVEGASQAHCTAASPVFDGAYENLSRRPAPSTTRFSARGPPPAVSRGR